MTKIKIFSDGKLGDELSALAVSAGHELCEVAPAEIIIEALIAGRQIKRATLERAAQENSRAVICASILNASVSEVSAWLSRPVVGWAMLPPLEKAKVVEVVALTQLAQDFFTSLGKEPVEIKDTLGGVLPRVVVNLINGAAFAVREGVASPLDIDQAMKLGTNYPHGPLEWADAIGLPQVLGIMTALAEVHGERYRPAPLLRQLAQSGRGFY